MLFVQQNQTYQTTPTVTLAYTSNNAAGNFGIAWCFCAVGTLPGSITDTQGNTWCLGNQNQQTDNSLNCYICPNLKAGANTVTAVFGTTSSVDVSLHIEEYSYSNPAGNFVLQPARGHSLGYYAWGVFGSYLWGPGGPAVPNYYARYSSGAQQLVTVTSFLGLYNSVAPPHLWGNGNSTVRSETEQSQGSTVSGEYVVNSATQRIFEPSFGIVYGIAPGTTPPGISYTGLVVVEF